VCVAKCVAVCVAVRFSAVQCGVVCCVVRGLTKRVRESAGSESDKVREALKVGTSVYARSLLRGTRVCVCERENV